MRSLSQKPVRQTLRSTLALLMALGYLVLGLSGAWHAPHFSQALESIDSDRHAHHEAVLGDECALCSVKTAPQIGASRHESVLPAIAERPLAVFRSASACPALTFAARPRAPPVSLS